MHVQLHCPIDELRASIKTERNPYVRTRLHAVAMAYDRRSSAEIASSLGYSQRVIFKWIKKYNENGKTGLLDKPRAGKPPLFTDAATRKRFCERLEKGPTDGKSVLHGKDVQEILKNEFGKVRSLSDVYYLLHSLGYEWLSPRPRHYRSSLSKQEEFKKKSQKSSSKLHWRMKEKKSKSGLKMKHA